LRSQRLNFRIFDILLACCLLLLVLRSTMNTAASFTDTASHRVLLQAGTWPSPTPSPAAMPGCTRSHGYWKNHPLQWPVESLELAGETLLQEDLLAVLGTPPSGDASLILAHQLIAALLNLANDVSFQTIEPKLLRAQAWLATYPPGSDPPEEARQEGIALALVLELFNAGEIGPGACDPEAEDQEMESMAAPRAAEGLAAPEIPTTPLPTETDATAETPEASPTPPHEASPTGTAIGETPASTPTPVEPVPSTPGSSPTPTSPAAADPETPAPTIAPGGSPPAETSTPGATQTPETIEAPPSSTPEAAQTSETPEPTSTSTPTPDATADETPTG